MPPRPDPRGVPLVHYRQHGAGVRLTCAGCMFHRDLPLEPIIARLEARGVGGAGTGMVELAHLLRQTCPRCGGRQFTTAPAFADRPADPNSWPALRRPPPQLG
jgi:hypothetical protein